jgi:hypothetical protein
MKRLLLLAALLVLVVATFSTDAYNQGAMMPNLLGGTITLRPVALTGTAGALALPPGSFFQLAGTTKQTSITTSAADVGRIVIFLTASTDTVVAGSTLLLVGAADFAGTANDILVLIGDGTGWEEVTRSHN